MEVNMKRLAYYLILFLTVLYAQPVVAMEEKTDPVVLVEPKPSEDQKPSEAVVLVENKSSEENSPKVVVINLDEDSSNQENVQAQVANSNVVLPKNLSETEQLDQGSVTDELPKTLILQEVVGEEAQFWKEKFNEAAQKVDAPQLKEATKQVDVIQILEKDNAQIVKQIGENGTFWLARLSELARNRLDKDHQEDKYHEKVLVMILKATIKQLDPEFFKQCNTEYKTFKQKKQLLLGALFKQIEQFKTDFRSRSWLSNGMHLMNFVANRFDGMLLLPAYNTSWWLFLPLLTWTLVLKKRFPIICTIVSQAWQETVDE
jgi:hypothetical protein